MGALSILSDVAIASRAKSLYGINLTLLHSGLGTPLDYGDTLSSMDLIPVYSVTTEILHTENLLGLSSQLNLIALHYLLDLLSDITKSYVNACGPDASISCLLNCS